MPRPSRCPSGAELGGAITFHATGGQNSGGPAEAVADASSFDDPPLFEAWVHPEVTSSSAR